MPRWEPDAEGRLQEAAMALFGERGYDDTTVAEIAERAGLTERTFFRYFVDKREVLFYGQAALREAMIRALDEAPPKMRAMEATVAALSGTAERVFEERYEFAARRQTIIEANPELQERELSKLHSLAGDLAESLRRRGVSNTTAELVAETGIALFKVSFGRWIDTGGQQSLAGVIRGCFDELRGEAARRRPPARSRR